MTDKLEDYKARHIRWQNFAITQLGYTNNIIITLSIAFLAYAVDKTYLSTFSLTKGTFVLKMFVYLWSLSFMLISIAFGVFTSISRLYDFKITRHIALTRQRFFEKC